MIARATAVKRLAENEFDVLVIGGGITGAGVALDAASRGYSVALIEGNDFASGTSSRSSKLVHGGLRYLQRLDIGLVREALLERRLMVKLAPHLVRPLPLIAASFGGERPARVMGAGLTLYDLMALDRGRLHTGKSWNPERHRLISGAEVLELVPALESRVPSAGYLFYDCQTDDARLVLTVLGEADRLGATCANRLWASELIVSEGRVAGARVREGEGEFEVRAASVVNATGVWADRLHTPEESSGLRIRPSRGSHITLRHADLPLDAGVLVPAGEGRSIFALPWLGRTLIGTTDLDYGGELEHVSPASAEVQYLLDAVNKFFATDLGVGDLTGAFAGLRPLIATGDPRKSSHVSRKAELHEAPDGMITITGGKLTIWRRMAKLVVDRLVAREERRAPCRTHRIPLGQPLPASELDRVPGLANDAYEPLARRYGAEAKRVLRLVEERPELGQPIVEGQPDLLAEVLLAARREQAGSVDDVLSRRTRLAQLAGAELSRESVRRVAELLGEELGWSGQQTEAELERFGRESALDGLSLAA